MATKFTRLTHKVRYNYT